MTKPKLPATEDVGYAASAFDVPAGDGRNVIQLLAIGNSPSRNGVPPVVRVADRAHADAIVAASSAYHRGNDAVVDYDHQTVFGAKPGVGGQAPAAGWMKRIFATDAGVFADVEWTAGASAKLDAREYRYISPVFNFEKATGRVTRIINAALTNTPALDLLAVASSFSTQGDIQTMDLTKIAAALGIAATSDEAAVLSAIGGLKTHLLATASALGLAETATGEDIAAAAATVKTAADAGPDPKKFVPIETVTEMRTEMATMSSQLDVVTKERRAGLVDSAIKGGKLFPSERDWALGYVEQDEAAFSAMVAARPAFAANATLQAKPDENGKVFDAGDAAVATAMGLSKEDYLASKEGISA